MDLIRLLLITTIATIIPGQLTRLPVVPLGAISPTDIAVFITVMSFLLYTFLSKKALIFPKKIILTGLIFFLTAMASIVLALNNFSPDQVLASSLFLIRFILYFLIIVVTVNVVESDKIDKWLSAFLFIGFIFTLIGILQIILIPDLSFLTVYGWDPHVNRLASSLLDPNFSGGLLTIFFSIAITFYLFKKKKNYFFAAAVFFTAIILTFSRSSYLAVMTAVFVIGLVKSPKIILIAMLLFLIIAISSNKVRDRILGVIAIDQTAQARIESWQNGILIFRQNPILGVGFNTYRFAQEKYGYFSFDNPQGGHSGSGSDSSLVLIAATTGILGFTVFLLLLFQIIQFITKNITYDYVPLISTASLLAILVHSQFVNSLFYPQIMIAVWFLIGLTYSRNN